MIDAIYEGKAAPRVRGHVGQFLRGCESGRRDVQHVLAREGLAVRSQGWVPGEEIGAIDLGLLRDLRTAAPGPVGLWGPVEHAPTASEQLGSVVDLTLWTSAQAANRAHVLLNHGAAGVRLTGGYRWFAPARVTTGDAAVEPMETSPRWREIRFMKAAAEDVGRPPHPLEYLIDYRLGRAGLKTFRVLAGRLTRDGLRVLPAMQGGFRVVKLSADEAPSYRALQSDSLALVLAYREPWEDTWHVVDAEPATAEDCLAHLLGWADFRAELLGRPRLSFVDVEGLQSSLATVDVHSEQSADVFAGANLTRSLLPVPAAIVRWFRFRS